MLCSRREHNCLREEGHEGKKGKQMKPKEFLQKQMAELEAIKDWNKDWPTSNRMAPKVCVDCGSQLEKPRGKGKLLMPRSRTYPQGLVTNFATKIRIDCTCGACYLWSFPNVYRKTHRFMELLMDRYEDGALVYPEPVLE